MQKNSPTFPQQTSCSATLYLYCGKYFMSATTMFQNDISPYAGTDKG